MEKILTVTLNPAIDKSTTIQALLPEKKLRCSPPKFEPGGGGVNVSRALKRLGHSSTALILAGGHTGKFFETLLKKEEIDSAIIPIKSYTRENLIVLDEATGNQYRFGMPGPDVTESEWRECLNVLRSNNDYEFMVISGSNPAGVSLNFYNEAAEIAKQKNVKLIVDTSEEALKHVLSVGVFFVKPNLGELSSLSGVKELDAESVVTAAREIINKGKCEGMVVSMGPAGAMLVTAKEHYHEPAPAVKVKSTVGAGDSMLAGIIAAALKKWDFKNILRYGIACGTAATMNVGTGLCLKENVDKIYSFFK
jgi:6-phosphofructokinase 2